MLSQINLFHSAPENIALSHLKADLLESLATVEEGKWMKDVIHSHGEYVENKMLDKELAKLKFMDPESISWEYLLNYEDEQQCYDLCFDNECNYIMFWVVPETAKFREEQQNPDLVVTYLCEVAKFPQKLTHDDFVDLSTFPK